MAQFIKRVRQWCQTCHRRFVTGTLIGAKLATIAISAACGPSAKPRKRNSARPRWFSRRGSADSEER
jgi:hypothetical protein